MLSVVLAGCGLESLLEAVAQRAVAHELVDDLWRPRQLRIRLTPCKRDDHPLCTPHIKGVDAHFAALLSAAVTPFGTLVGDLDKARRAVTPLGPEGRDVRDAHVAAVEFIGGALRVRRGLDEGEREHLGRVHPLDARTWAALARNHEGPLLRPPAHQKAQ